MKRAIAGPSLRTLVAAAIGRVFTQCSNDAELVDYRKSGTSKGLVNGVLVKTDNLLTMEKDHVQSRMNWEISHPNWVIRFVERRELGLDGSCVKAGPYQVSLLGDLTEAARFLGLARTIFLNALKGDGWSRSDVIIEGLRWVDVPYAAETPQLRLVLQGS